MIFVAIQIKTSRTGRLLASGFFVSGFLGGEHIYKGSVEKITIVSAQSYKVKKDILLLRFSVLVHLGPSHSLSGGLYRAYTSGSKGWGGRSR